MASRMVFISHPKWVFVEKLVDFVYFQGLSASQKKKSMRSLHSEIQKLYPDKKILEVSTKSDEPLGVACSAFNLTIDGRPLECVFQSSKVFEGGVSFPEIINYAPKEAKNFIKEQNLKLSKFSYKGVEYPLEPKSLFYDYLYITALLQSNLDFDEICTYDIFTDIEFNQKKQVNCQARSMAIFKALRENGWLEAAMKSPEDFAGIVYKKAFQLAV